MAVLRGVVLRPGKFKVYVPNDPRDAEKGQSAQRMEGKGDIRREPGTFVEMNLLQPFLLMTFPKVRDPAKTHAQTSRPSRSYKSDRTIASCAQEILRELSEHPHPALICDSRSVEMNLL